MKLKELIDKSNAPIFVNVINVNIDLSNLSKLLKPKYPLQPTKFADNVVYSSEKYDYSEIYKDYLECEVISIYVDNKHTTQFSINNDTSYFYLDVDVRWWNNAW